MTATHYQTIDLGGNGGSSTSIHGEGIVSNLTMGGTAQVTMTLDATYKLFVNQVALVK